MDQLTIQYQIHDAQLRKIIQYSVASIMNTKQVFPSFLDSEEETRGSMLTFRRKSVLTLMDMVKEELGNTLNPKFISNHRKELETPHFALEAQNKYKKWTIIKRLPDIIKLEQSLKYKYKSKVPSVPIRREKDLLPEHQEQILEFFCIFMNALSRSGEIMEEKSFVKFIENFVAPERKKMKIFKQLQLLKRAGGRHNQSALTKIFVHMFNWSKRFFTITSEGVYFTSGDEDFRIQQMIPFSEGFKLLYGEAQTGYTYGIILNSAHRMLNIDAESIFNMTYFVYWLRKAMKENNYLSVKRFGSFANVRHKCHAQYFVDGIGYFSAVCDAILSAKTQIFITGWFISPYFCLKRPDPLYQTRFDKVLERVAKLGIKINILLYMEPKVALNIDSEFSEEYLTSLSPNIKVLRHPAYLLIPFLWSHHEKMVIIDQKVAFLGGLDIGYGRYDDNRHLLTDLHEEIWPGIDYCNYRTRDIYNPRNFTKCELDRETQPRMPWHDVSVKISGQSVIDLSRHFVQYWNHANFQLKMDERELLMYVGLHEEDIADYQKSRQTVVAGKSRSKEKDRDRERDKERDRERQKQRERQKERERETYRKGAERNQSDERKNTVSPKRYSRISNNYGREANLLSEILEVPPEINDIDDDQMMEELQKPRMLRSLSTPYEVDLDLDHEEEMEFYASHMKGESSKDTFQKFLNKLKEKKNLFQSKNNRQGINFEELIVTQNKQNSILREGCQTHQLLRSASMWSLGLEEGHEERSIMRAYVQLIFHSKEFIYIENQFFISIQNTISKALIERIGRAYDRKEKFKVVVVIPSLPGFDGEIQKQESAVMRIQLHHIYETICRGGRSILECLSYIDNIDEYIQFYTLRTHGVLNKTPVTEIVYVHSKIMIVDDQKVIIGSANINDRSLLGSRDSEIAVVIEDQEQLLIDVHRVKESDPLLKRTVRKFAHDLRKQLFIEHFSLSQKEAEDYHNDDVWWSMIENGQKNQKVYRKVFGIYPDDKIRNFRDLKIINAEADLTQYQIMKDLVKGRAVLFQKDFLCEENLTMKPSMKEYYVPDISFT